MSFTNSQSPISEDSKFHALSIAQQFSKYTSRSEFLIQDAWNMSVRCHGELVTTDLAIPNETIVFSKHPSANFVNLAAQGLRDGDAVG